MAIRRIVKLLLSSCLWALPCWGLLWAGGASAVGPVDFASPNRGGDAFQGDFGDEVWTEGQFELPAPPAAENLVAIDTGAASQSKFYVDEQSVTVGNDGVVRYTLVVVGSGGARNVSYEGMRCVTGERRLYAFGRVDGSWSKARGDEWVRIAESGINRHHAALYRDYFCTIGGSVTTTESARRVLPKGNPAAAIR